MAKNKESECEFTKKKTKTSDLEIEKKAIMDMSHAKKHINCAIIELTSALSRRCFSKSRTENSTDIEKLSSAVDQLIDIRNDICDTLEPYLVFHCIDESDLEEWLLQI